MSRAATAVAPQERYVAISPAIRGTLLDLVRNEVVRIDKARELARKHRVPRPMLDKRAEGLRALADELAR